jgi:hypothetical protein
MLNEWNWLVFWAGLTEVPGGKVGYASPKTMEQDLKIAVSELEA